MYIFEKKEREAVKSAFGKLQLDIPRDRNGEFELEIVPKYCRDILDIEEKVISLYARGLSTRDSFKYVSYKNLHAFSSDFKAVYKAPNEENARKELEDIKEKWGKKYPYAISNWDVVNPFFQFSDDIRRIMYTTNIIEGLNRQFRKAMSFRY